MKTKRDYITKYNTVTVYHSKNLDRIIKSWEDYFYKRHIKHVEKIRQSKANKGIYSNYGNGALPYISR